MNSTAVLYRELRCENRPGESSRPRLGWSRLDPSKLTDKYSDPSDHLESHLFFSRIIGEISIVLSRPAED